MAVSEYTVLKNITFVKQTPKSRLVQTQDGTGYWIPLSQIKSTIATEDIERFDLKIPTWLKNDLTPVEILSSSEYHEKKVSEELASTNHIVEKDMLSTIRKEMKVILEERLQALEGNKPSWEHLEKIKIAETCMKNLHLRFDKLFPREEEELEDFPF